jgi:hypothetical protein
MGKNRLEAFSDGVIAILITIMVLELKVPHDPEFRALLPLWPVFMSYVLSFIYIGIYWNKLQYGCYPTILKTKDCYETSFPVRRRAPNRLRILSSIYTQAGCRDAVPNSWRTNSAFAGNRWRAGSCGK